MGAKREFFTVNGQIIAEQSAGGPHVRYMPDATGSVTVANDGANHSTTFTPYGAGNSLSAATFGWAGCWGYLPSNHAFSTHYVRRRSYGSASGRWTSSSGNTLSGFKYAENSPVSRADPSGYDSEEGPLDICVDYNFWPPHTPRHSCVDILWEIGWYDKPTLFPNDSRYANGAIIQEVEIRGIGLDCDCPFLIVWQPKVYHYVEGWTVKDHYVYGRLSRPYLRHDKFSAKDLNIPECTFGVITWKAKIGFYPNASILQSPWGPSNGPPAGGLQWVELPNSAFKFPGKGAPTQSHELTINFDCCTFPWGGVVTGRADFIGPLPALKLQPGTQNCEGH